MVVAEATQLAIEVEPNVIKGGSQNKLVKGEVDFLFNFYILSYYIRKSRVYRF